MLKLTAGAAAGLTVPGAAFFACSDDRVTAPEGEINDPAMWNRSLPGSEIEDVHQDGVDLASLGLAGYWNFNEGEGQDVYDRSPAWNHGFLGADAAADSADPIWSHAFPPSGDDRQSGLWPGTRKSFRATAS